MVISNLIDARSGWLMAQLTAKSNHVNVVRDCALDAGIKSGGVRGAACRSAFHPIVLLPRIVASDRFAHTV